jgi:hypothetical protein
MSLPVNGKTVEMRLVIFGARINYISSQIYYDVLADFPSTRSRVGGLHIYIYIQYIFTYTLIYMYIHSSTYIYTCPSVAKLVL